MNSKLTLILLCLFLSKIALCQFSETLHIHFETNRFDVSINQIDSLKEFLEKNLLEGDSIILKGHTDKIGNVKSNLLLSEKRCLAIKDFLVNEMQLSNGITAYYHGEEQLLSEEETTQSHKLNRRVEVLLKRLGKKLSFKVLASDSGEKIDARIVVKSGDKVIETTSIENIDFEKLPQKKLTITALAKGYYPSVKRINTKLFEEDKVIEFRFREMKLNSSFQISDLFFYGGVAKLKETSNFSLDNIVKLLDINDDVCVELSGHVNLPNRPKVERNTRDFYLSIARAQVVNNYLTEGGIDSSRILVKGYGNHRMRYPNAINTKQEAENRRVEIENVKCDSIQSIVDDHLEDSDLRKLISNDFGRLFSKLNLNEDMKSFPNHVKRDVIEQVKYLESQGKDPRIFTYAELLKMLKRRIQKK